MVESLFGVIIINLDINNPEFHIKIIYLLYLKAATTNHSRERQARLLILNLVVYFISKEIVY